MGDVAGADARDRCELRRRTMLRQSFVAEKIEKGLR